MAEPNAENGAGQYRIVRHPTPSPSALALARTRPTIEGAVADMGDGVVIAPDGHIAAFHERHLAVIERLAARNLSPELSRSAETNPNTTTSVLPPGECHCLVDIPHREGEIAECVTPPGGSDQ